MTTNSLVPSTTPIYTHPPESGFYFRDGAWLTFFLTLVLYMTLAISMNAAHWVELNTEIFTTATLGAVILGMLMARSRFDGLFMVSHGIFSSLAWVIYLMTRLVTESEVATLLAMEIPDLRAKSYFILLRWLDWIEAVTNRTPSQENLIFVLYISLLIFWLAYLGTWAIFRHGFVWRGVMPAGVALMVNTYYAPNPVVPLLVIFCLTALILLVRANLAEQQLRWRERHIRFSSEVTYDFLRNGLILSVVVVALAWIAPSLGGNTQLRKLMQPINATWEETSQEWSRLYEGLNRQTRPTGGVFGRTLTLGGARDVTNSPVFVVDAPVGRYWRAVVFDTFTGRQWLNTSQDEVTVEAGHSLVSAGWDLRMPLTQTVTLMRSMGNVLVGTPDMRTANVAFTAQARPALPVAEDDPGSLADWPLDLTLIQSTQPLGAQDSYTLVSDATLATEWMLERASTDYPAAISETFLQLPENMDPRVTALAQELTAPFATVFAKTKAIERHLRGYAYDDQIPAPSPEQDPVSYFLFDLQRGYCDYYATSMAVMLRSVGIPARTVSGYAEGFYDDELDNYFVTEADAHTWVEVYFPGLGWIEFEPTAGESVLERPAGSDPAVVANGSVVPAPDDREDLLPDDFERGNLDNQPQDLAGLEGEPGAGLPLWAWALLTVVGLGLSGLLVLRVRKAVAPDFTPDWTPILYARLQRWADRLGLPIRPGQTPYEHAESLGDTLPSARPAVDTITDNYVRYRFAGQPPVSGEESWHPLRPIFWKARLRKFLGMSVAEGEEVKG
ncbi:MAG: transglutaminase domain-containing protein [Caldilineaceae bacterium]|nr:transglutaminase domain-containing protein [Caldilineaceae bacterium]MBP9073242.1 transglutaminase domain-containing protein [Caldilineaceae bacterium]